MLKVNLETELRNQKQSIVTAKELLLIKEHENLGANINAEAILSRVGINKSASQGKEIKSRILFQKQQAAQFASDKVYHISQIEKLCHKYALRFLPAAYFKGSVPTELADKIATFETTYQIECCSFEINRWSRNWDEKQSNTFIIAPASSFNLQARPKDPLLFYKINESYYYLIHKWGNDLSKSRRLLSIIRNKFLHTTLILSVLFILSFLFRNITITNRGGENFPLLSCVFCVIAAMTFIIYVCAGSESNILGKKSDWDSPFKE